MRSSNAAPLATGSFERWCKGEWLAPCPIPILFLFQINLSEDGVALPSLATCELGHQAVMFARDLLKTSCASHSDERLAHRRSVGSNIES